MKNVFAKTKIWLNVRLNKNYDAAEQWSGLVHDAHDAFFKNDQKTLGRIMNTASAMLDAGLMDSQFIDLQTQDGMNFLHIATRSNDVALMEKLIQHGADTNQADKAGRNSMWWAVHNQKWDAAHVLARAGQTLDTVATYNSTQTCSARDILIGRKQISQMVHLEQATDYNKTTSPAVAVYVQSGERELHGDPVAVPPARRAANTCRALLNGLRAAGNAFKTAIKTPQY